MRDRSVMRSVRCRATESSPRVLAQAEQLPHKSSYHTYEANQDIPTWCRTFAPISAYDFSTPPAEIYCESSCSCPRHVPGGDIDCHCGTDSSRLHRRSRLSSPSMHLLDRS